MSSSATGLTSDEARDRLAQFGPNQPSPRRRAFPYTPLAAPLEFVPLPFAYLIFVAIGTAAYLLLTEGAKRLLLRRHIG
jgi:hypothetical protein